MQMQENKDGNHAADPLKGSDSGPRDSSSAFLHNSKLRNKLNKLARWRIDPSLIEFPEDAREFRGGFATVSRAFLAPSPRAHEVGIESAPTEDEHPDPAAGNLQPRSDTQERKDDQQGKDEESDRGTTGDGEDHGEADKGKESGTHEKRVNSPTSTPKADDGPESGDRNALPQEDIQGHGDNHPDKDAGTESRTLDGDNGQANSDESGEGSDNHQERQSHPLTDILLIRAEPLSFEHAAGKDPDSPTQPNPQTQTATRGPGDDEQGKDEEASSHVEDAGNDQASEEQNSQNPQHKVGKESDYRPRSINH
ncbi:hypothetical protein FRC01_006775 [Tulasnella sp. 417]|nr:hypothetical protein FRC01_006775 [Tulasnella sp. 417]